MQNGAIRRPPLGVCGVKGCCTAVSVVLLYCCTALYPVYGILYLLFRGHKPRTTAATAPTISANPGTLVFTKVNGHDLLPLLCSCYRPAAGATLQGLCRKGYAVWGYAAGAMLQESWMMADDDDGW